MRSKKACILRQIDAKAGDWTKPGPAIAWFSEAPEEALTFDSDAELVAGYDIV